MPAPTYQMELTQALGAIRVILESTHPNATPGEKLVRIGWVIGNLPAPMRDTIIAESRNRVGMGWALNLRPERF